MSNNINKIKKYWDIFYKDKINSYPKIPSQFSVFIATELIYYYKINKIIEFGSGNFRDSNFFARNKFNVVAIDPSGAIEEKESQKVNFYKIGFQKYFDEKFKKSKLPICIYGRFFLHAIDKKQQDLFFDYLRKNIKKNDIICLEFRIEKDIKQKKIIKNHKRYFVDLNKFEKRTLRINKFKTIYKAVGKGFAKFKSEDAFIARYIIRKK